CPKTSRFCFFVLEELRESRHQKNDDCKSSLKLIEVCYRVNRRSYFCTKQGIEHRNRSRRNHLHTSYSQDQSAYKHPKLTGIDVFLFLRAGHFFSSPHQQADHNDQKCHIEQNQLPRHSQARKRVYGSLSQYPTTRQIRSINDK